MNTHPVSYIAQSPYCEHQLDPASAIDGWVTCECGHKSAVEYVTELGWLQARMAWIKDRIVASDPATSAASATVSPSRGTASTGQRVLYVLGGLSFITAVAVFTAVAWENIGGWGQLAVLVLVTTVASFVAIKTRTALPGLASTGAVIASGVALTGLLTAPTSGLLPEFWQEPSSGYPLMVVLGISALSIAAGLRFAVGGWLLVSPFGVVASALLFTDGFLPSYMDERYSNAVTLTTFTAGILVLDVLSRRFLVGGNRFFGIAVTNSAGQVFLALGAVEQLTDSMGNETQRFITGPAAIAVGFVWWQISRRWPASEDHNPIVRLVPLASPFVAVVLTALGFTIFLRPGYFEATELQIWIALAIHAILGAIAYMWTTVKSDAREAVARTFAIAMWFLGFTTAVAPLDNSNLEQKLATYFGLITVVAATRWVQSTGVGHFVVAVIAGTLTTFNIAIAVFADDTSNPEAITLPIALWLAVSMLALRLRSVHPINTGVWLGIPLAVALIPSAAASVALVEASSRQDQTAWIRLWVVLLSSLILTIVGASKRISGLLWPGAIAYIASTFPQLFIDLELIVPRWIFFAVLGALLITTAARFERLQKLRSEVGSWSEVFR